MRLAPFGNEQLAIVDRLKKLVQVIIPFFSLAKHPPLMCSYFAKVS